jgi:tetratricopeptide (TPR) repeat protein
MSSEKTDQLSAHLDRAWDLVSRGDLSGALRSAEKSLELDGDSPEVHNLLGYVAAQEGRGEEAIEHYERAIELDESFVEAMLNAAECCIHPLGDWDAAIAYLEAALEWIVEDEELADALLLEVEAYLGKKDLDGARGVLARVPAGPFENPGLSFALGRAHHDLGDLDRAKLALEAALGADPMHSDAAYYLGLVYEQKGDRRSASVAFLQSRDAELRRAPNLERVPQPEFEKRVRAALGRLSAEAQEVLEGALVLIGDVPGAEVVAEGVDPRIPLLLDDVAREPTLKAGRLFVYQRNVERTLETPSLIAVEDAIVRFVGEELEFLKKGPPPA